MSEKFTSFVLQLHGICSGCTFLFGIESLLWCTMRTSQQNREGGGEASLVFHLDLTTATRGGKLENAFYANSNLDVVVIGPPRRHRSFRSRESTTAALGINPSPGALVGLAIQPAMTSSGRTNAVGMQFQ